MQWYSTLCLFVLLLMPGSFAACRSSRHTEQLHISSTNAAALAVDSLDAVLIRHLGLFFPDRVGHPQISSAATPTPGTAPTVGGGSSAAPRCPVVLIADTTQIKAVRKSARSLAEQSVDTTKKASMPGSSQARPAHGSRGALVLLLLGVFLTLFAAARLRRYPP